jgi:hypothetical protein
MASIGIDDQPTLYAAQITSTFIISLKLHYALCFVVERFGLNDVKLRPLLQGFPTDDRFEVDNSASYKVHPIQM